MRRLVLALAAVMMLSTAAARNVTVHAVDHPAEEVFRLIMARSGKNFVYESSLLKGLRVSVNVTDRPLSVALGQMFDGTDIEWRMKGDNVVLTRRVRAPRLEVKRVRVSGFVTEHGSGEALIGAVVTDTVSHRSTAANARGFFSMSVPRGKARFVVTYPGMEAFDTGVIDLDGNLTLNASLGASRLTLDEVEVIGSRSRALTMESASMGTINLTRDAILSTPVIFGESDVIKSIQLEPGVSSGIEGMAGMMVHGGNDDENLYMLDNVPLYQVNHLGGLFSAFNTEAVRNVDFYKSSFPARYDGRLSSFMDVHTIDGSLERHNGTARLGLTSGAFSINGPIVSGQTTYMLAVRRSWYDLLTVPACAIINAIDGDSSTKTNFGYAFTDVNAKINHRLGNGSSIHAMFYYGDDYLRTKTEDSWSDATRDVEKINMRWGNLVASVGWNHVFSKSLFGELTAAYTRYRSTMDHRDEWLDANDAGEPSITAPGSVTDALKSVNNINDWIVRADMDWRPTDSHTVNFGAGYTRHSFLPSRSTRTLSTVSMTTTARDSVMTYHADELNIYAGDDWDISRSLRVNFGAHFSLFAIDGKIHTGLSPRVSARWSITPSLAAKASYSRTTQYVHQLSQSSISLPTDQWIPITAAHRPQTADKVAVGAYYDLAGKFIVGVEGYMKWMDNLVDYRDEYYLLPPSAAWDAKLATGRGTAKGIDFKVAREVGRLTGHVAYSLLWADRTFAERNGGVTYPARNDNRHKINVMVNWKVNDRWEINTAWTGMSGNRVTLPLQNWSDPSLGPWHFDMTLKGPVNNLRLPFYHRLDLSFTRHTSHGFWNFSLYNAYCHMNVIAVTRGTTADVTRSGSYTGYPPVFQYVSLIPIIPSVSYTWTF